MERGERARSLHYPIKGEEGYNSVMGGEKKNGVGGVCNHHLYIRGIDSKKKEERAVSVVYPPEGKEREERAS